MKNRILSAFILTIFLTTSCSKNETNEYANPENISGTTWKCTSGADWDEEIEYALFVFTSTTIVEAWSKEIDKQEEIAWTGSFTISGNQISIQYELELSNGDFEVGTITGSIDGETMNTTIFGESYIFLKQ